MPLTKGQSLSDAGEDVQGIARGFAVSKAYNDGVLVITGTSQSVGMIHDNGSGSGGSGSQTGVVFAYLVTNTVKDL